MQALSTRCRCAQQGVLLVGAEKNKKERMLVLKECLGMNGHQRRHVVDRKQIVQKECPPRRLHSQGRSVHAFLIMLPIRIPSPHFKFLGFFTTFPVPSFSFPFPFPNTFCFDGLELDSNGLR